MIDGEKAMLESDLELARKRIADLEQHERQARADHAWVMQQRDAAEKLAEKYRLGMNANLADIEKLAFKAQEAEKRAADAERDETRLRTAAEAFLSALSGTMASMGPAAMVLKEALTATPR